MFGRSRECGVVVVKVFERRNTSGRLGWGMNEKEGVAKQDGSTWQQTGKRDKVRVGMEQKSMEFQGLGGCEKRLV
jgi:hypothetical protein